MIDAEQRVRAVINGQMPDRAPLYDLLRNDAVISHFAGDTLTLENAPHVVPAAYAPAIDATRPSVRLPGAERTEYLEDGREQRHFRWTTWTEHKRLGDPSGYAACKRQELDAAPREWTPARQERLERDLEGIAQLRERLGEVFLFPGGPLLGLMGITGEVGLESFAWYLAECPGIIIEQLERHMVYAIEWITHLPENHGIEAVFSGDDIAFKNGPLLSPDWFEENYFPRLKPIIDTYHRRGIKVLFHSDGNLNSLMDGLVAAGIDGLNPIEVVAGMDVADLHRRYPHLFLAGGIDVSQLLPYGRPDEIHDVVRRTLEAAEGRIMIGSSTELNNEVPLENFMAMREAVLDYQY